MTTKANRIVRYYDTHELEGAELTESRLHRAIILHLILVLEWIFNGKNVGVTGNINLYQSSNPKEPSKSPDIVVVEGFETYWNNLEDTPSYYVGEDGPPPLVVFQVASEATWRQYLEDKPAKYVAMGVNEYLAFDPNTRTFWTGQWREHKRLIGWRRNPVSGEYELLQKDADGRLWSEELQSWLVMVKNELQLYTIDGQRWITKAKAEAQLKQAESRRADIATRRAEAEAHRADTQKQRAEAAERQIEVERQQIIKMIELLRKLGHDPDQML